MAEVLAEHRSTWKLAESVTLGRFIAALESKVGLRTKELRSSYDAELTRYLLGEPSVFAVALSLRQRGYLSHGTAALLHELTDQIPKVIYLNVEQSPKPRPTGALTQSAVARAFQNRQRSSSMFIQYDDYRIFILNGMSTNNLGVSLMTRPAPDGSVEDLRVTEVARTLIDITVRANYAGGVTQVLEAYRRARTAVDPERILSLLRELNYVYPWHQAIGFYMQRAGYSAEALAAFRALRTNLDFYLSYGLKAPNYDSDWRIHFPEGL